MNRLERTRRALLTCALAALAACSAFDEAPPEQAGDDTDDVEDVEDMGIGPGAPAPPPVRRCPGAQGCAGAPAAHEPEPPDPGAVTDAGAVADAGMPDAVLPEAACINNTLMAIGTREMPACAECACMTALNEALACDLVCWNLFACVTDHCTSGMDTACIVAECAEFLGAASPAMTLNQAIGDACRRACPHLLPP